eukprot:scaffold10113_cov94-Skeletonema_dohrnii-CCMP3373.AAC.1
MKLSTAAAALLLLSANTVDSFTPTHQFKSLQLRQQQNEESVIVNYNNVGHQNGENNDHEGDKKSTQRFGMNIMGVLSSQLYATKVRYYNEGGGFVDAALSFVH